LPNGDVSSGARVDPHDRTLDDGRRKRQRDRRYVASGDRDLARQLDRFARSGPRERRARVVALRALDERAVPAAAQIVDADPEKRECQPVRPDEIACPIEQDHARAAFVEEQRKTVVGRHEFA